MKNNTEKKKGSGNDKNKIGTVNMVCGCGFSTTSTSAWVKHRQEESKAKLNKIKGPPTQKRFKK